MERLHFGCESSYSAIEAAIHVSRYAVAKAFCEGREVLDVACGEGYGSHLMSSWGAKAVSGVDIAAEAIKIARAKFQRENITFHEGDVTALQGLFADSSFDLIVSLETIEHVQDPEAFLKEIRRLARPDASIVISCPNDHWYYRDGGENAFHLTRFRFDEFKSCAEQILGPATSWKIGSLTGGFLVGSVEPLAADQKDDQSALLRTQVVQTALQVPVEQSKAPTPATCSFFLGVWGPTETDSCVVSYPLAMDEGDRGLLGGPKLAELETFIQTLQSDRDSIEERLQIEAGQLQEARADLVNERARNAELQQIEKEMSRVVAENKQLQDGLERAGSSVESLTAENKRLSNLVRLSEIRGRAGKAEITVLRDRARHLTREVQERQRELEAAKSEITVLRDRFDSVFSDLAQLHSTASQVPWRVVGAYKKLRPLLPKSLLRLAGHTIDALRRRP